MCGFCGNLRYLNLHPPALSLMVLYEDLQQVNSNLIKFNQENCHILHPEMNKPKYQVHVEAKWLERSFAGKALGVLVDNKVTMSQHGDLAAKINSLQSCIRKSISSRLMEVILLSAALMRSHLQCWVQSWALQYKRDMHILEWVQKRATMMVKGLEKTVIWEEIEKAWTV